MRSIFLIRRVGASARLTLVCHMAHEEPIATSPSASCDLPQAAVEVAGTLYQSYRQQFSDDIAATLAALLLHEIAKDPEWVEETD